MLNLVTDLCDDIYIPVYVVSNSEGTDVFGRHWVLGDISTNTSGDCRVVLVRHTGNAISYMSLKEAHKHQLVHTLQVSVTIAKDYILTPSLRVLRYADWIESSHLLSYYALANDQLVFYVWNDFVIFYRCQ